jgi:NADH-quinone oxidoreductase subunit G
MLNINIDNLNILIKPNISILEACKYIGINIPKFCYHESLSIAGNCRMCLVELQKTPKPVASCAMPVVNNMTVFTSTPLVKKARENVLETLLINHPLDCPICDQGGECDLQDETKTFGIDFTRFFFNKRSVEDKECGLVIKTIMTRCIHCTRCVRFSSEIAGNDFFGTINRGTKTEISNYILKTFNSFLSGNVIDLCPVGALTSKNYAFKARPWELKSVETIDLTDSAGTSIYFNYKESEIIRVLPKINKDINENWISDRIRFSFDSFSNSRLHSIFEKKTKPVYSKSNWNFVIKQLKIKLFKKNEISCFLINSEIDLQSLVILKKIINYSKKKIVVINTDNIKQSNLYVSWLSNKLSDIKKSKTCFLFFSNIYVENLIINIKLKTKYNKNNFEILNFGNQFNSNFPINFSNVSLKSLVNFFESKLKNISKILIQASQPLLILGENLTNKFSNNQYLNFLLKKIIPNSIVLNANSKCNTESLKLLNISSKNTNIFKKSDFLVSINLNDNLQTRKYFNITKENFWLNSHGSLMAIKNKFILPTLNNMEENNIFINLEQRPQETSALFTKINNAKSTKFLLKYILKSLNNQSYLKQLSYKYKNLIFLEEFLKNSFFFKKIQIELSDKFIKHLYTYQNEYIFYYKSSVKSIIEDFYLTNTFCKNSLTMNNFSINHRNINKNFFF